MTPFLQVWNCFQSCQKRTVKCHAARNLTSYGPAAIDCTRYQSRTLSRTVLASFKPIRYVPAGCHCARFVCKLKRWWSTHLCGCFLSIRTHVGILNALPMAAGNVWFHRNPSAQWNVFFPKAIKLQSKIQVRFHWALLRLCIHGNSQIVNYFLNEHILLFAGISEFGPAKWKCIWTYSPAACNATLL